MGTGRSYLSLGRSLVTGAVMGLSQRHPGRLDPLASGMPTGATLIGRPGRDGQPPGYAHAFEQATRLRVPAADPARHDDWR